jgi:hypothetical protein
MAGKHHAVLERLPPRQRLVIGVGLALWLFLVVGLIAFLHKAPDPALADPAPQGFPTVSPPVPPTVSRSVPVLSAPPSADGLPPVSASASTSRAASASASPPRRAHTKPPPVAPAQAFTARYVVAKTTSSSFRVGIILTNNTRTSRSWQIRVTHDPADGVRFQIGIGARISQSGSTTVFSGGPLNGGRSVIIAFRASKHVIGVVRPTSCVVDGKDCIVSVQ